MNAKSLYMICGCNGAGKTTASYTVLPEVLACKEFVNADEIARGLSPFNPSSQAIEAGRLMLERIKTLLMGEESFAIETTLVTKSYISMVRKAKEKGFYVQILYFWLQSPELAVNRVAQRVEAGGHDIPVETIRRRYKAGIDNLFSLFKDAVDLWTIYDNSETPRTKVAYGSPATGTVVLDDVKFQNIMRYVRKRSS